MMTVPMDNLAAPSRELVQRLHQKNIDLESKRRKSAQARIPSDPNAWQQMRENYEAIILEDHAFSEQHEIEYALWQLHYKRIEELRAHFSAALASAGSATPGGKGLSKPDRIKKIRSQFKTFLSEATGFYHDLILKIQAKYGLPLGHFSEQPHNVNMIEKDGKIEVKKGLLSCHRCLIYLGDLARYKGLYGEGDSKTREYAAASSYYMQAASLWPLSGNPHHQLAILASYSGDDLGAIYRYFRSLAVSNPFTTARDNLIIAFEKNRQNFLQLPVDSKVSSAKPVPSRKTGKGRGKGEVAHQAEDSKVETSSAKESTSNISEIFRAYCIRFVRLNGILFTRTSLETFGEIFSLVIRDLHALLSSGSEEKLNFGTDAAENALAIVRLVAILIFTVHNVNRETEGQSYAEILQRSVLLQNAFTATFEIMGHILKRSTQLHDLSSSYLLPGILVFVEWLAFHPDIAVGCDMEEKQATARSFFWNHYILFLNKLVSSRSVSVAEDADETCFFNMSRYDEGETDNRLALWEDVELRGFLPLVPAQFILDFSRNHSIGGDGSSKELRARVQRILAAGRALVNVIRINDKGVYFDQKLKKFIIGVEPPSETTNQNGMPQEDPVKPKSAKVVSPKAISYMEGEEDEEEIVFKPTISEKFGDMLGPKLSTYDLGPVENYINGEVAGYCGSTSTSLSNVSLQNNFESNILQPASFGIPIQNQQPSISGVSNWPAGQHNHLVNGLTNLSITGNGFVTSAELKDGFGSSLPTVYSLPVSEFVNPSADSISRDNIISPEAVIPSKLDSIMSSGFNADGLTLNPSAAPQTNSRKNPVSRPVRHHGPPPGFTTVPPKQLDEGKLSTLKDENAPVDDYSWLDGYQLSSSTKGMTVNSVNHTTPMYPPVMKDNSSLTGTINFPFPGKQVPTMQVQDESQKSWQDYQLLEQLKIFQEQQQFQQANQQSALPPEQYQGQSLWSGRYFV